MSSKDVISVLYLSHRTSQIYQTHRAQRYSQHYGYHNCITMQVCSSAGRHVSTVQNFKGGDSVVHKLLLFFKFPLYGERWCKNIIDDKAQISSGVVNGGTFWPTARRFAESVIHSNAAGWPTIVAANRTASIFQQKHNDEQGSTTPKLENGKNKNRNTRWTWC